MPRLLEELRPGTPVRDKDGAAIGEVRGVYGSGDARTVEFLLVYWTLRDEEALLPADEAMHVGDEGVTLRQPVGSYADRAAFDPAANPMLHRL